MGTPSKAELAKLNPNLNKPNFPIVKCYVIEEIL